MMIRITVMLLMTMVMSATAQSPSANPAPVPETRKIWDAAGHNAFTDLIRWHEQWWCTFREADGHIKGDGKIRVITSRDGDTWESAALVAENDVDLRDPKFSVTPDDRLMIVCGGSIYHGTQKLLGRQPRVLFSKDGRAWTPPQKVLAEGDWLWRVTWHDGKAYGTSYSNLTNDWQLKLYSSNDGLKWDLITPLEVPDKPNETTLRFLDNGQLMAMVRREAGSRKGWIGTAQPPYTQWNWHESNYQFGGPNFIQLPDGSLVASTRDYRQTLKLSTLVARMTAKALQPVVTLPSGGDNSYPGLVWHEGMLWVSYYSSHKGKTSIYLARIQWPLQAAQVQTNNYAAAGGAKRVEYPRVNTTTWYEVDPAWPQRPAGMSWGQIPGIAIDQQDNVWIYTRTNQTVQVYAPDGHFVKSWQAPSPRSVAHGLRIDQAGNVWLVDVGLHVVTKHAPDGKVLLTLGTEGEAGCDANHFFKPTDVAVAPNGDIYVADGYGNARIVHYDKNGRFINSWGHMGIEPGCFSIPHAVVCDSKGQVYVADRNNARIQVFDDNGRLLDVWRDLMVPWGFWISPQDEIWACGSSPMTWGVDPKYPTAPLGCPPKDQLFMRFNTTGKVLQIWSVPKAEDGAEKPGTMNWLHGVAVDSKGNLYGTDIIGQRVQKLVRKTNQATLVK